MASDFEHHGTPIKSVRVERAGGKAHLEVILDALYRGAEASFEDGDPTAALKMDEIQETLNALDAAGDAQDAEELERLAGELREQFSEIGNSASADLDALDQFVRMAKLPEERSAAGGVRVSHDLPPDRDEQDYLWLKELDDASDRLGGKVDGDATGSLSMEVVFPDRASAKQYMQLADKYGLNPRVVKRSARHRVTKSAPRWLELFVEQLETATAALGKAVSVLDNNAVDEDIDVSDRRDEVIKLYESVDMLLAAVVDGDIRSYESDED